MTRIFIGPVEISGIAAGIQAGLAGLGVSAETVLSFPHPFSYTQTPTSKLAAIWLKLGEIRISLASNGRALSLFLWFIHKAWGWLIFIWAVSTFDVFIFMFGESITGSWLEIYMLKRFKKKIIVVYCGSDARPAYIDCLTNIAENDSHALRKIKKRAARQKKKLALFENYADYIINSPSSDQLQTKPYINWFSIGVPRALQHASLTQTSNVRVRILHSPSNPSVKGTKEIEKILDRLAAKGHQFDFVKIENMSNEVVLHELARCDFVVDQMYSDTPLAIFATEAAFFAKPAVVGGYSSFLLQEAVPPHDLPPSLYCEPQEMESIIERCIVDHEFRLRAGQRARRFVRQHWSAHQVAQRFLRLIKDDVPDAWWVNPHNHHYTLGCGQTREHTQKIVGAFIRRHGSKALQLSEKPELEAAFLAMTAAIDI